jgi:hypothetical protein
MIPIVLRAPPFKPFSRFAHLIPRPFQTFHSPIGVRGPFSRFIIGGGARFKKTLRNLSDGLNDWNVLNDLNLLD